MENSFSEEGYEILPLKMLNKYNKYNLIQLNLPRPKVLALVLFKKKLELFVVCKSCKFYAMPMCDKRLYSHFVT